MPERGPVLTLARQPIRIQRQRTRGWRMPEGAVYVGRPSTWGNPVFVDERGNVIATERYEMSPEIHTPAIRLPTIAEEFSCLRCGAEFMAHPGEAMCPACGCLYCRAAAHASSPRRRSPLTRSWRK